MITYLIEVTICWFLFYSIYVLLLSKETFFSINRWYLLSTLVLGLLIPLFTVEFSSIFYEEPTKSVVYLAEGFSQLEYTIEASVEEAKTVNFSWLTLVIMLYTVGVLIAFGRFLHGFKQIYNLYEKGTLIQKGNYKLVLTNKPHLPFSFFNYLFWSESLALKDKDSGKIITHELAHINQWHSLDVLFLEFLSIALWFSPPIYWYKKSLRTVHEYLADAYVLRNTKKEQYGHLLIRQVQSGMQVALANNFIHSQLKQRINMMTRNKSRRKALTRYLPAIPLLLLMILVFSNKNVQQNFNETTVKASLVFDNLLDGDFNAKKAKEQMRIAYRDGSKGVFTATGEALDWDAQKMKELDRASKRLIAKYPEKESAILMLTMEVAAENGYSLHYVGESMRYRAIENFEKKQTFKVIGEKPRFPGGEEALLKFIYTNIKYPAKARNNDIYGNLTVQFIVEKDGSISNLKIKNDLGGGLKEEVFRVMKLVQELPTKWTPATYNGEIVRFTYDLAFAYHLLEEDGTTLKKEVSEVKNQMQQIVIVGYGDSNIIKEEELKKNDPVYKEVDEMPRFPGCETKEGGKEAISECAQNEMLQFIYTNIQYPEEARKAGIEGTVVVKFVVDQTGKITKREIVRSLGGGTDEQVLAIVDKMPIWVPGKNNGKAVSVYYHLPVKFKLADDAKPIKKEAIKVPTKTASGEKIYKVVDEMPRFSGCDATEKYSESLRNCANQKMLEFIYTNVKYPETARKAGIEGVAVIRFLVEKDGTISDAEILRNPGGGTGEEALRVVSLMKEQNIKWIPGLQDGKPVNVNFNLPIKFKLAADVKVATDKETKITEEPKDLLKRGLSEENVTLQLGKRTLILNAFPNPATEQLTITLEGTAKDILVTVFDISGKEYFRDKVQAFDGTYYKTITLDNTPKGTLIVNVRHKGKDYQKKVIAQ